MAVILANQQLTLLPRAHSFARDAHGQPVAPAATGPARGPYPGSALQGFNPEADWSLRLDPRMAPVEPADEVTDGTRTWVVVTRKYNAIAGYPDVDYIAVTATLNPPQVP